MTKRESIVGKGTSANIAGGPVTTPLPVFVGSGACQPRHLRLQHQGGRRTGSDVGDTAG